MIVSIVNEISDIGTLRIQPERDDSFQIGGYANAVIIDVPLYAHEARQLIEILQPLADKRGPK